MTTIISWNVNGLRSNIVDFNSSKYIPCLPKSFKRPRITCAFNPSQHRHDQSNSRKLATFEFSWKWHISKKLKKQHRRFQAKKEPIFLLTRLFELSFLKKSTILVILYRRQSTNNLITNRSIEIDHSRI